MKKQKEIFTSNKMVIFYLFIIIILSLLVFFTNFFKYTTKMHYISINNINKCINKFDYNRNYNVIIYTIPIKANIFENNKFQILLRFLNPSNYSLKILHKNKTINMNKTKIILLEPHYDYILTEYYLPAKIYKYKLIISHPQNISVALNLSNYNTNILIYYKNNYLQVGTYEIFFDSFNINKTSTLISIYFILDIDKYIDILEKINLAIFSILLIIIIYGLSYYWIFKIKQFNINIIFGNLITIFIISFSIISIKTYGIITRKFYNILEYLYFYFIISIFTVNYFLIIRYTINITLNKYKILNLNKSIKIIYNFIFSLFFYIFLFLLFKLKLFNSTIIFFSIYFIFGIFLTFSIFNEKAISYIIYLYVIFIPIYLLYYNILFFINKEIIFNCYFYTFLPIAFILDPNFYIFIFFIIIIIFIIIITPELIVISKNFILKYNNKINNS